MRFPNPILLSFLLLSGFNGLVSLKPADAAPPRGRAAVAAPVALAQYDTMEVALDLPTKYDNPYDPDQILVTGLFTSPTRKVIEVPGFYWQNYTSTLNGNNEVLEAKGGPGFKVRFTPNETGRWTYRVYAKDKDGLKALRGSFQVKSGRNKGFIRRGTKSSHYLRYDSGAPYFLIGENLGWAGSRGTHEFEEWIKALASAGGNWMRVWMVNWSLGLEWKAGDGGPGGYNGVGRYSLDNAWKVDRVLELAKRNGVGVMLTLGTYGDLKSDPGFFGEQAWDNNPYNVKNGGPVSAPAEFFTNPQAKALYKQKLRYLVARYAHSTALQSWEFWNEMEAPAAWVAEMSAYLRDLDPYNHLISTTYGNEDVWKIPQIDFTQTHHYGDGVSMHDSGPVIASQNLDHTTKYGKPHLVAEFGIDWKKTDRETDPKGLAINFHNGLWASAMSRGMGGAAVWWWDNYIHPLNLYKEFTPLARFAAKVPWADREWQPIQAGPLRNEAATKEYTDLVVPATFGWGKLPGDAVYTLRQDGQMEGGAAPQYLYSPSKPDLRSTLRFKVNYPQPGRFNLRVQEVMSGSHLKITLDGNVALEKELQAGLGEGPWKKSEYQAEWKTYKVTYDQDFGIDVPAGEHEITVENTGQDWMTVSEYRATNYRSSEYPAIRLLGQQSGGRAVVWLQDERSNWVEAQKGTEPKEWSDVVFTVKGLPERRYRVIWWDTRIGNEVRISHHAATKDGMTIRVPTFRRDIAAYIVGGS